MRYRIVVAGYSTQGILHVKKNVECQDSTFTWKNKDKLEAYVAVSDGAGCYKHSKRGADLCVRAPVKFLRSNFDNLFRNPNINRLLVEYIQNILREFSEKEHIDIKELSATLSFVYIKRFGKTTRYIAGNIGDGAVVIEENDKLSVLSHPEKGEYANTTYFLPLSDAKEKMNIYTGELKGRIGFLLFSDGAGESLYIRKEKRCNEIFCKKIFEWCDYYSEKKVVKILKHNLEKGLFKKVSVDDCSIAVLRVSK